MHPCPCCTEATLTRLGAFEICPRCGWEDDGQSDADARSVRGGPNGALSLEQARAHFARDGSAAGRSLWRLTLVGVADEEESESADTACGLAFVKASSAEAAWETVEIELRAAGWRIEERVRAQKPGREDLDEEEREFFDEAVREGFVVVLDAPRG